MSKGYVLRIENLVTGSVIVASDVVDQETRDETAFAYGSGRCFVITTPSGEKYYFNASASSRVSLRVQTVDV